MNPEQLSDAMNELPQELLEETQAARSRWRRESGRWQAARRTPPRPRSPGTCRC